MVSFSGGTADKDLTLLLRLTETIVMFNPSTAQFGLLAKLRVK